MPFGDIYVISQTPIKELLGTRLGIVIPQTQTLSIESRALEHLIPYARNARTHSDEQVSQIAGSIAEFGFNNPILVDRDGGIIAGHGRALAARQLNLTHVPVIVLDHLTENQKRAFILADNKLALSAGWDEEMLRLELEALAEQDFELALTGFDDQELKDLLIAESQRLDPNEVPEPPQIPTTKLGDVWVLGDHRLLCGDGLQIDLLDRLLDRRKCELVFTDLPYNVDYTGKDRNQMKIANDALGSEFGAFLRAACKAIVSVSTGPIYICMSSGELHRLYAAFTEAGGHWSTYVIWAKNNFTLGRSDYQRQYEPILYGWPQATKHYWCGDRNQGDIWFCDKPHANKLHPTMKPVELIERAIENSSRKGDVVLDPFAGSGSTLIACQNLGRRARVVELEPRYADVIVRRWEIYTGCAAHLEENNHTFAEVVAMRCEESEQE